MIIYDLTCANGHYFEGWFATSADYQKQQQSEMISCPVCGNKHMRKLPTAAYIKSEAGNKPEANNTPPGSHPDEQQILAKLIEQVINNTEDVGNAFAEEARKIHYQEAEPRNIRGTTSVRDVRELVEEGIEVFPIVTRVPGKLH